jgi:hypothetical protein
MNRWLRLTLAPRGCDGQPRSSGSAAWSSADCRESSAPTTPRPAAASSKGTCLSVSGRRRAGSWEIGSSGRSGTRYRRRRFDASSVSSIRDLHPGPRDAARPVGESRRASVVNSPSVEAFAPGKQRDRRPSSRLVRDAPRRSRSPRARFTPLGLCPLDSDPGPGPGMENHRAFRINDLRRQESDSETPPE